jgi:hypothetical protein
MYALNASTTQKRHSYSKGAASSSVLLIAFITRTQSSAMNVTVHVYSVAGQAALAQNVVSTTFCSWTQKRNSASKNAPWANLRTRIRTSVYRAARTVELARKKLMHAHLATRPRCGPISSTTRVFLDVSLWSVFSFQTHVLSAIHPVRHVLVRQTTALAVPPP